MSNISLVVNELLAYVFHKYNSDHIEAIQSDISRFYCDDDVSEAMTQLFQHYADVVGPKPSRQNRGNRSLKEKEVGDIMEAMKKLDESGPARPVIFVAVNLTNLPSIMRPTELSTSNNRTINDDYNVRHRLTILEMQMAEMLAAKTPSASSPAPREITTLGKPPASSEPSLQGAWSRARQSSQQAPHFIQQPTVQQRQHKLPTSQVEVLRQSTAGAPAASLSGSEWQTVRQKKVRDAKYGRRKDGEHPSKAIPRRHDFVVFNVPQDCSVDTIKSYISDNGVQVLDISRLSKEEWNNQSFCVTVLHVKEPTVSDPEFWPEDIGYRRFFKKRINQQNNERNNTT